MWDLQKSLDVILPFDWIADDRKINKPGSNIDGLNYLLEVYQWGNEGDGHTIFGE